MPAAASDSDDRAKSPRRQPDVAAAVRALLEDAVAFGVEGFGREPTVAAVASAPTGETAPPAAAAPGLFAPPPPTCAPDDTLQRIADEAAACRRCPLGGMRKCVVPGQGNPRAELMFVGEAPGADEDASGLAFVGAAGQLLTKMIAAMGCSREDVFIANVLKCRPPNNREPQPEEVAQCLPYLERQIALIRPRVLVCLGSHAARNLLATDLSVGKLRGRVHDVFGAPAVVTYHPAYLLRSPGEKAKAWEDLQLALKLVGRSPPSRGATPSS